MSIYDKASLVLIPSGTKTSKVYSQKPTNGDGDFTFSRSTAATRVNASGNIEKETSNLLLQSNQFDTTWAAILGASVTSGQSGYDGSNDAWTFTKASGQSSRIYQNITLSSPIHTTSIYAKAGTLQYLSILEFSGPVVYFDLTNGTIGTISGNPIDVKIEAVGATGWYRCSITDDNPITQLRIYASDTDGSINGAGTIFIQDAQVEQGLVARDYIETTTTAIYGGITDNVPRLDYTDSSCPALLLEPQRTNINPYSEYFGTFWNALGSPTITSNYGVSPEGLLNATRFQTTDAGRGGMYASIAVNNGTTYTLSFYAKSLSGTQKLRIGADNGCVNPQGAETFEVTTEWQKFSKTITSTQGGWNIFFDNIESGSGCTGTYLNCDMLVYGFQVEAGSYATSYIPTYGSAVTRNAEESYANGQLNQIGQTEGTIYAEFQIPEGYSGTDAHRFQLSDNTTNNWIFLSINNGNDSRVYYRASSSTQLDYNVSDNLFTAGNTYKVAFAYKNGDSAYYVNGVQKQTWTTLLNSPSSELDVYMITGSSPTYTNSPQNMSNNVKQTMLFKTRLSNEELAALTTI